jgi:hypothetical protein
MGMFVRWLVDTELSHHEVHLAVVLSSLGKARYEWRLDHEVVRMWTVAHLVDHPPLMHLSLLR